MGTGIMPKRSTLFQDGDLVYAAVLDARLAKVEAVLGVHRRHLMSRPVNAVAMIAKGA